MKFFYIKFTIVIFLLFGFLARSTDSGVILSLLLKILAVDGFFHIGLPLAIGGLILGSGIGFIPGVLFGGITALTAAEEYYNQEFAPDYLIQNQFHQHPFVPMPDHGHGHGHGHDGPSGEEFEYFEEHDGDLEELQHHQPKRPIPYFNTNLDSHAKPIPYSYVDFYQEISQDLENPLPPPPPAEDVDHKHTFLSSLPQLEKPHPHLDEISHHHPAPEIPHHLPPAIESYVEFFQVNDDSDGHELNQHQHQHQHPNHNYYQAGDHDFYIDDNYNPIFLTDGSTPEKKLEKVTGGTSSSSNAIDVLTKSKKPKGTVLKLVKRKKKKKFRRRRKKRLNPTISFGGDHTRALNQNGLSLGSPVVLKFRPSSSVVDDSKSKSKKSDIFDKARILFPWGFTKKSNKLADNYENMDQNERIELFKKLRGEYINQLKSYFNEKNGWKPEHLSPAIPQLQLVEEEDNINRIRRSHMNYHNNAGKHLMLKKFEDNVKKYFNLLSAFDQNQCLKRVVCEIHARSRSDDHKLGKYELNILQTFRVIEKVLPLKYDGSKGKQQDNSVFYRISARLGILTKNLQVCHKYFPTCKSNSNLIIQLGNRLESEGLTKSNY